MQQDVDRGRSVVSGRGWPAPAYLQMVEFDQDGVCTSPEAFAQAVAASDHSAAGEPWCTDVFLFSHGWNNSYDQARSRYLSWATTLLDIGATATARAAGAFVPTFVGVRWPSLALADESETGPILAAASAAALDHDLREALSATLSGGDRTRLDELVARPVLGAEEAGELAALLAGTFATAEQAGTDGADPASGLAAADLTREWELAQALEPSDDDTPRSIDEAPVIDLDGTESAVAGGGFLRPVWLLRLASILLMKDRAQRVGAAGARNLLADIINATDRPRRIHLIGHSFGAKVLLSALCGLEGGSVHSALLLQPAMSARCFAADAGAGRPGGYRAVLDRVQVPILSTWSVHDFPLRHLFQLAARRASDLGDPILAAGDSKWVALGGYGPQLLDPPAATVTATMDLLSYPAPPGARLLAVDGSQVIGGHGDVTSLPVARMLFSQLELTG